MQDWLSTGVDTLKQRLGEKLELVSSKQVETLREARSAERMLKMKKNPQLAIHYLQRRAREEHSA
jgi:hypothetical protein